MVVHAISFSISILNLFLNLFPVVVQSYRLRVQIARGAAYVLSAALVNDIHADPCLRSNKVRVIILHGLKKKHRKPKHLLCMSTGGLKVILRVGGGGRDEICKKGSI